MRIKLLEKLKIDPPIPLTTGFRIKEDVVTKETEKSVISCFLSSFVRASPITNADSLRLR